MYIYSSSLLTVFIVIIFCCAMTQCTEISVSFKSKKTTIGNSEFCHVFIFVLKQMQILQKIKSFMVITKIQNIF